MKNSAICKEHPRDRYPGVESCKTCVAAWRYVYERHWADAQPVRVFKPEHADAHLPSWQRSNMRRFTLERSGDVSGTSGTGRVAEGIEFSNGEIALTWFSSLGAANKYPNMKTLLALHGHEGRTLVKWIDEDPHAHD